MSGALALPLQPAGSRRLRLEDAGLWPLLFLLPFMYVPKVLEGDTQPWVLGGAVFALFFYRPHRFLLREDLIVVALALLSLLAFLLRAPVGPEMLRAANMFLTFAVLWVVFNRGPNEAIRIGVRYALTVWFLVALFQYVALSLGVDVVFSGRFVAGRSGVPGMAAEPSYLGSISVLMAMYLLHEKRRSDLPFLVMAAFNVVMSGSILGAVFLVFPLMLLPWRWLAATALALVAIVSIDLLLNDGATFARFAVFQSIVGGLVAVLVDPSINIRFGHIHFALWTSLDDYALFRAPLDFMNQYNAFAAESGLYIPTTTNFIMPSAGELVYQGGLFGLLLLLAILRRSMRGGSGTGERLLRLSSVAFCLLNPVSIANPFLVMYVVQPPRSAQPKSGQA